MVMISVTAVDEPPIFDVASVRTAEFTDGAKFVAVSFEGTDGEHNRSRWRPMTATDAEAGER